MKLNIHVVQAILLNYCNFFHSIFIRNRFYSAIKLNCFDNYHINNTYRWTIILSLGFSALKYSFIEFYIWEQKKNGSTIIMMVYWPYWIFSGLEFNFIRFLFFMLLIQHEIHRRCVYYNVIINHLSGTQSYNEDFMQSKCW